MLYIIYTFINSKQVFPVCDVSVGGGLVVCMLDFSLLLEKLSYTLGSPSPTKFYVGL